MIPISPLHILFLVIIVYDLYYFLIFLYQSFQKTAVDYSPPITVVVPVYNNESTIKKCIKSIVHSDYDIHEIIVVNDGSTDRTKEILDTLDGITVYTISHSGKGAALNYGIDHSFTDIVTVDADTVVEKDTIKTLARNLKAYDAVAGNLQVLNGRGFLGRCQAIEHVRVAMFRKVAQYFKDVDIIPGPLGAFRQEIFSQIQYGTSRVEDMELTQQLRDHKFTIGYEQDSKAYTKMPTTWISFLKQRFRWAKGNLELLLKKKVLFKKFLTGYGLAFLDLSFAVLCVHHGYYVLLLFLFVFESFTMLIGNQREKTGYFLESVLFPGFMLFLDGIFLLSHTVGLLSILKESLQRRSKRLSV